MQLEIHPIWPWPVVAVVIAAIVLFSYWTYQQESPGRRLLLTLRWLTILLAAFAILRPRLVFTRKIEQSSVLVILVDKSRSMTLRDEANGKSRWQTLKEVLLTADPDLVELAEEVQIRKFEFSSNIAESLLLGDEPQGQQTALGKAIESILEKTAGERLAGIVILTDGVNTTGISPQLVARRLSGQRVPIHTVGFGRETVGDQVRDVSARSIVTNPTVFAKNKMTVHGEFSVSGYPQNHPVTVRLLTDGIEKARGMLRVSESSDRGVIELTTVPDRPGDVKVTIQADLQKNELLPSNNAASTYVTVLAGGISVLYVEGKYRFWEPKFIRWALDRSPDIELTQLYLLDTHGKETTLPKDLFEPGGFDIVILGDVPSNRFDQKGKDLAALRDLVQKQGVGLMMLGGYESFGPGNWGRTPLAEVLPVIMKPADGQLQQTLKMVPTAAGLRHFILRLAANADHNQKIWESLRPLDGASTWSRQKPGALLLATSPTGVPLLAAQEIGKGRSLAFAGDTTWRWRRKDEGIASHARFWRQLILWLAHQEDVSGTQIQVKLNRRRLAIGQKLSIEIGVEDADGSPLSGVELETTVELPDSTKIAVDLIGEGDGYLGTFWKTDVPGDYRLIVSATAEGTSLREQTKKFLVHSENAEMRQLAADLDSLRDLSRATAGEFCYPEQFAKLIDSLRQQDLNLEVSRPIYETLWDRWQLLLLFIALITAEWVIRKRHGLA